MTGWASDHIVRPMMDRQPSPYGAHLGFEIAEANDGRALVRFDVQPHHQNTLGIVHGGVASSLIDHTAGVAIISRGWDGRFGLTTRLEVEFLAPIRRGNVECEAHVREINGDRVEVAAEVRSSARVCARGTVWFAMRNVDRQAPGA